MRSLYEALANVFATPEARDLQISSSAVQFIEANHPVIEALATDSRVRNGVPLFLDSNLMNGFFVPEAFVLRAEAQPQEAAA